MKEEKYGNQKKAGVTILMCIKEKSEIKKYWKDKENFYCGKKSRRSRRYTDHGSLCIKQYGLEICKMGTKRTLGRNGYTRNIGTETKYIKSKKNSLDFNSRTN